MADDITYFNSKRPDRVYLSPLLSKKTFYLDNDKEVKELVRPFRIISKIVEGQEAHKFIKDGKQISLRITDGERQEITAKFYEDTREIFTLNIQKYTIESGVPHNSYFTFVNDEISVLYNFIRNVAVVPLNSKEGVKLDDKFVEELSLTKYQLATLLENQPDLVQEIVRNNTTTEEVM
ncbi:MAG: hypothetical protein ACSHWN_12215, partial [Methylophilaceae bacterium]